MIDQFAWFCLSNEDKAFLSEFKTPRSESSLFKWIPLQHLERVKALMRRVGYPYRIVYRGPRNGTNSTRKAWATAFSVYGSRPWS